MDVQHQERRTCQHKFPPKSIEPETLDSVFSETDLVGSEM